MQFERISCRGEMSDFPVKKGHISFTSNGSLFLDGGFNEQNRIDEGLYEVNLETMTFSKTIVEGQTPLVFHSCLSIQDDLFTYDVIKRKKNFFIGMNSNTIISIRTKPKEAPPKPVITKKDKVKKKKKRSVYVFGGINELGQGTNLMRVYTYTDVWKVTVLKTKGQPPCNRHACGMKYIPITESIAVFGGSKGPDQDSLTQIYLNDLYLFKIDQLVWIRITYDNNGVEERSNFCMEAYDNDLIIFGGLNKYNFLNGKVIRLSIKNKGVQEYLSLFTR